MIRPDFQHVYHMNILIVEFEWVMEHLIWYKNYKILFIKIYFINI
jgi:hypothetical protein